MERNHVQIRLSDRRLKGLAAIAVLGCLALALPGCQGDSQFSAKETQQFKDGPPKEMPPEARAAMQRGLEGRKEGPPPGAGGPPPGAAGN